jgi:hypothetical protein
MLPEFVDAGVGCRWLSLLFFKAAAGRPGRGCCCCRVSWWSLLAGVLLGVPGGCWWLGGWASVVDVVAAGRGSVVVGCCRGCLASSLGAWLWFVLPVVVVAAVASVMLR